MSHIWKVTKTESESMQFVLLISKTVFLNFFPQEFLSNV